MSFQMRLFCLIAALAIAVGVVLVQPSSAEKAAPAPEPAAAVEAVEPMRAEPLPDFSTFDDPREKKSAFIDYLAPVVERQNQQLLSERQAVQAMSQALAEGGDLAADQRLLLGKLAERYNVGLDVAAPQRSVDLLLRRVDIVPVSLALIQAAKETGWGTSRFAQEGNNLFGQRCFREGCGIDGKGDSKPGYARFDAPAEAVASYMHNLNTNPAYLDFRKLREQLRERNEPITGPAVAGGLHRYSVRGEQYIRELRSMILRNELHHIDESASQDDLAMAAKDAAR